MAIRILTKNGIENTNIDGARDNNFNAGRRSGIIKGVLNEGNLYGTSNTLTLEPCELRICGHRVVIDENENRTFTNKPQTATKQSLIGQIQVDGENVVFELIVQNSSTSLVQDNLDINGTGTYQLEIGTFTQNTDGTITDVARTAEILTNVNLEPLRQELIDMISVKANKDSSNLTDADISAWLDKLKIGKDTDLWAGNIEGLPLVTLADSMLNYKYLFFFCIQQNSYRFGTMVPAKWFREACNSEDGRFVFATDTLYCSLFAFSDNQIKIRDRSSGTGWLVINGVN